MFISQTVLNPRRRGAKHLLYSPQRMHAVVMAAFAPSELPQSTRERILWRVDEKEHHHELLVVSPGMPDLTQIVEEAGWPQTSPGKTKDYGQLLSRVQLGSQWHFRVRANPVTAVKQPGQSRGKILAHTTVEQQANWWISRAEANGMKIIPPPTLPVDPPRAADLVQVKEREISRFHRSANSGKKVTLSSAVFEGALQVTDAERLKTVLVGGIGRGRAYGCGLLTLATLKQ